jgi:hypothetical protein
MNSQARTLLFGAFILVLIYVIFNKKSSEPTKNEGNLAFAPEEEQVLINEPVIIPNTEVYPHDNNDIYMNHKDYAPQESVPNSKFSGRNSSKCDYKKSNYADSTRGNLGPSDWDDYFDNHNNIIGNSQADDGNDYMPIDESMGNLAIFKNNSDDKTVCGSNQNCSPEDLHDIEKYLPQEVNNDFFEVQPESVSVKNRHLINVTKPIGINTIGTSKRNMCYDFRGAPAAPKYVVSPWLQSSIEADVNLKPMY